MVRYNKDQREKTRTEILRVAARLFRNEGYNGVSVDNIMEEAGLTRGGFYYHFASKSELFAEVLRWDHDLVDMLQARAGEALADEAVAIARDYLEPAHRHLVGPGCVLTTLMPDVVRAGGEAQEAFVETVQNTVNEFCRGLSEPQEDDPRALVAAALCVGGLLLARGTDGTALADKISRACQQAVSSQLSSQARDI